MGPGTAKWKRGAVPPMLPRAAFMSTPRRALHRPATERGRGRAGPPQRLPWVRCQQLSRVPLPRVSFLQIDMLPTGSDQWNFSARAINYNARYPVPMTSAQRNSGPRTFGPGAGPESERGRRG